MPKVVKVSDDKFYLVLVNLTTKSKKAVLLSKCGSLHNTSDVFVYKKFSFFSLLTKEKIVNVQKQLKDDNVLDLNLTYRLNTNLKLLKKLNKIVDKQIKEMNKDTILFESDKSTDDVLNILKLNQNIKD